jgi:asparagine synthase (glutamine-hydrolysing)
MAGFTVCFSNKSLPEGIRCREKIPVASGSHFIHQELRNSNFLMELHTNAKFHKDKSLTETSSHIICTEGVILNLDALIIQYQAKDVSDLIKLMFQQSGEKFPSKLRGDFSGFIYDKKEKSFFIYTNHTGSKRIFYFQKGDLLIFSSDLGEVTSLMNQFNLPCKLYKTASYLLLTNGFMPDENTLVEDVKRLMPGCSLQLSLNKNPQVSNYFHLKEIPKTTDSKTQIINKMDELFAQAIRLEFEKDKSCGYQHIATLSGGLDSRMTVLMAHKLGYSEQLNFTFSQANYLDEQIAKHIAVDHQHDFLFQSLDGGNYLKNADNCTWLNDGLVLYPGSAHVFHAVQNINFEHYGLIHTGLIGDAVIGSFLTKPEIVTPSYTDGMYSSKLAEKVTDTLKEITFQYSSEEIYKFYSRGFLGAMNGNYTFDLVSQAVSPFLDVDFLSYCISIPEHFKFKQKIYLEWIAAKHPEFARYPWEKTGVSPLKSNNYKKYFDIGFYKRMSLKFFDKLSGQMKSGMNPFDYWMKENTSLRNYTRQYFDEHIGLISFDATLQEDCRKLFLEGNTGEKLQVLTLLAAVKLHKIHG